MDVHTQTLVSHVARRYAKGGGSVARLQSIGRLSFISSGSLSTKTRRKGMLGNKQRDSLSLMDAHPSVHQGSASGTVQSFLQGGRLSMVGVRRVDEAERGCESARARLCIYVY